MGVGTAGDTEEDTRVGAHGDTHGGRTLGVNTRTSTEGHTGSTRGNAGFRCGDTRGRQGETRGAQGHTVGAHGRTHEGHVWEHREGGTRWGHPWRTQRWGHTEQVALGGTQGETALLTHGRPPGSAPDRSPPCLGVPWRGGGPAGRAQPPVCQGGMSQDRCLPPVGVGNRAGRARGGWTCADPLPSLPPSPVLLPPP